MKIATPEILAEQSLDADSLPICYWNEDGHFTPYSTEEILANRLNGFKNWTCTAGVNSLFIHFEGDVYRGTCTAGGASGNIYDSTFKFPQTEILCPKEYCMCGGDIMVPKFKTPNSVTTNFQLKRMAQPIKEPVAVTGSEILNFAKNRVDSAHFSKRVIWSIGKRCNYDCSYCTKDVHSSTEPIKSETMLLTAAEKLVKQFCHGEKTIFYIAGGEPTLYPGLLALTKYLCEIGHECVVVSNGSTKTEIYHQLIQYAHVCLSVHFEFLNVSRFLDNVRAMTNVLARAQRTGRPIKHRLDVKVMTKPGTFPNSIAFAKKIYCIFKYRNHGSIRFNPIWTPENPEILFNYTADELLLFKELNTKEEQEKTIKPNPLKYFYNAVKATGELKPIAEEILRYGRLKIKKRIS